MAPAPEPALKTPLPQAESPWQGDFLSQADFNELEARDFPVIGPDRDPLAGTAEARYRALIRHLPDTVVALYDRDLIGVSIDGPRVAEASFPAEAFEGKPLRAVMPAADYDRVEPHYRAALEGVASSHELTPLANGVVYHLEIVPFRLRPGG